MSDRAKRAHVDSSSGRPCANIIFFTKLQHPGFMNTIVYIIANANATSVSY